MKIFRKNRIYKVTKKFSYKGTNVAYKPNSIYGENLTGLYFGSNTSYTKREVLKDSIFSIAKYSIFEDNITLCILPSDKSASSRCKGVVLITINLSEFEKLQYEFHKEIPPKPKKDPSTKSTSYTIDWLPTLDNLTNEKVIRTIQKIDANRNYSVVGSLIIEAEKIKQFGLNKKNEVEEMFVFEFRKAYLKYHNGVEFEIDGSEIETRKIYAITRKILN